MKRNIFVVSLLILVFMAFACGKQEPVTPSLTESEDGKAFLSKAGGVGDPQVLALMQSINNHLAAQGQNFAVEAIEFLTIGSARPSSRLLQLPFRWVPNDQRRLADGTNITYLVDATFQGTISGVSAAATEAEIDASFATWEAEQALQKVDIIKRADPGSDVSISDEIIESILSLPPGTLDPEPDPGFPFFADIVHVGWYSRDIFDAFVPNGGDFIGAFALGAIFGTFDPQGNFIPSDINGDNYLDLAIVEVYYNDNLGDPNGTLPGFPWTTGQLPFPSIDVQSIALHENGHGLCIGHFGPPPAALMNPGYPGPQITPLPTDQAAMNAVWSSWPNP